MHISLDKIEITTDYKSITERNTNIKSEKISRFVISLQSLQNACLKRPIKLYPPIKKIEPLAKNHLNFF